MSTKPRRARRAIAFAGLVAAAAVGVPLGWLAFGSSTRYAPGFHEEAFERIQPGMSVDAVHEILGSPLRVVVVSRDGCERAYDIAAGRRVLASPVEPRCQQTADEPAHETLEYSGAGMCHGTHDVWSVRVEEGRVESTRRHRVFFGWDP